MSNSLKNKKVKIVEKFGIFISVSLLIIIAGVVMLFVQGMNLGVEFKGGMTFEVTIGKESVAKNITGANEDAFKTAITDWLASGEVKLNEDTYKFNPASNVQKSGDDTYEFRVDKDALKNGAAYVLDTESNDFTEIFSKETGAMSVAIKNKVVDWVSSKDMTVTVDEITVNTHTIGNEVMQSIIKNAAIAVAVAVAVILVYVAIRFTWISGIAAILALVHDVLVMTACTIIFQIPVNSTFIAAVITIIGYSINATIVIFDRVRELEKNPTDSLLTDAEIANKAIVSTLWRSILTTLTTLVMIVALAIFGNSTIREFALPIIFGLIAGAYSSVLLSAPIWVYLRKLFGMSDKRPKVKVKAMKSETAADAAQA